MGKLFDDKDFEQNQVNDEEEISTNGEIDLDKIEDFKLNFEDIFDGNFFLDEQDDAAKPQKKIKRKRRTKEEMEAARAKDYVDNENLLQEIIDWRKKVDMHNAANMQTILEYQETILKANPKRKHADAFQDAIEAAVRAKAIDPEPRMPDNIGTSITQVCQNFSTKHNWVRYTWRDEMTEDAILNCIRGVKKFDYVKYQNPFGYFTQIANYAFCARITKEKKAIKARKDQLHESDFHTYDVNEFDDHDYSEIEQTKNSHY